MEAMCRCDDEAFGKVYLSSVGPLVEFLKVLLRSREDAEDLAQNVFAYVYENRDKIDPARNFNGYLFVVAKNLALKHIARKKLYDRYQEYVANSDPAYIEGSDNILIDRETSLLIDICIDNMPEHRKKVFSLHRDGKSDKEIADTLAVSINTVRTHLRLAKKGLTKMISRTMMLFL